MKWIYRYPRLYNLLDSMISISLADKVRRRILEGRKVRSVLEIGVGTGKCLDYISADLAIGLDRSEAMLNFLRRSSSVGLVLGDAHKLPFRNDSFDLAIFCFCLAGLRQPAEALSQALSVSREVVVIEYNRPGIVPKWFWRWVVRRVGSLIFGSRDVDFSIFTTLGTASIRDLYSGLYKVVTLNGVPDARD